MSADTLIIRELGIRSYETVWHSMQDFTNNRTEQTQDEVWLLQHYPVFTQGTAGKAEHLLMPGDIPVVQSDRSANRRNPPQVTTLYFLSQNSLCDA